MTVHLDLNLERDIENFWLIAMACGCAQALQAMSNGAAVRSGIGAIWVGAMSATISALTLILIAVAIYRLPLPTRASLHLRAESRVWRHDGGVYRHGPRIVAPKLGPTQTFILYFFVIAVVSALIDGFGLLGTEARPLEARSSSACCSPVSGWCSLAPEASDWPPALQLRASDRR